MKVSIERAQIFLRSGEMYAGENVNYRAVVTDDFIFCIICCESVHFILKPPYGRQNSTCTLRTINIVQLHFAMCTRICVHN